ncbi:YciI family protein [Streptosporangium sandarakinum]|uniref:YciI family protein n=1 Tax=Streptosporangium sandarakinum TaxID=1260955 RepID=UPI00341387B6
MRYLITLRVTAQPATPPPTELMEAIMKLGEEATGAGVLLDTAGLAPNAQGARVELAGGRLSVTDGPFAETKELISYALYQVRSKEEAVEWASRFLRLHRDLWQGWEGEADIRRVMGPEDFAAPA